ncbi:hypothetical protein [Paracoccus fontiphilus]|uniref:Uncharacterized protein n=1 Tax=Paracoccus fontiphilus TaxID=1815556 RepID=A0ABV7IK77_9RHOB|nr:hypothetical protein [Paracoccus fontiphilus]
MEDKIQQLRDEARELYIAQCEDAPDDQDVPVAEYAPALLLIDVDRRRSDPGLVPDEVWHRVRRRRFRMEIEVTADELTKLTSVPQWVRRQISDYGYGVMTLPLLEIVLFPRGRRQLSWTERRIRDALRLWTYALFPSLSDYVTGGSKHNEAEVYRWLAEHAPNLSALAKNSHAGRKNGGTTGQAGDQEEHPELWTYIPALMDEGRKLSMHFPDEPHPRSGEDLRWKVKSISDSYIRRLATRDPKIRDLAMMRTHVIDTLAKAKRISEQVMAERVPLMADYGPAMGQLLNLRAHHTLKNPDQYGKRVLALASKVLRSQMHEAYVQPPTLPPADRLSARDLATLAFLCDVDPYVMCAGHMLYNNEIAAMRTLGRLLRGTQSEISQQERETFDSLSTVRRNRHEAGRPIETEVEQIAEAFTELPEMLLFELHQVEG